MRNLHVLSALMFGGWLSAYANFYHFEFDGGTVPDGNVSGWTSRQTLVGIPEPSISGVTLTLNISGGYNGDLYAYLTHGSAFIVLLNRPGLSDGLPFGYADAGFTDLVLADAGEGNIHNYGGRGGAAFGPATRQPDGREVSPLVSSAMLAAPRPRLTFQKEFGGMDPNGEWVLFVADLSGGGGTQPSTVKGWDLSFATGLSAVPVPEPATLAAGVFACVIGLGVLWRGRRLRRAAAAELPRQS